MRRMTILILAVLVAFPALGWAQVADTNNPTAGTSIQGYGEQTASYQTGCVQVDTYETGTKKIVEVAVTGTYTNLGNQCNVPNSLCGTDLSKLKFEGTTTTTTTAFDFTLVSKGTYLAGNANMNSLGGLSLCSTAGISAEGNLSQTHSLNQTAGGTLAPGITGSATYTGTQSFNASIKSQ